MERRSVIQLHPSFCKVISRNRSPLKSFESYSNTLIYHIFMLINAIDLHLRFSSQKNMYTLLTQRN